MTVYVGLTDYDWYTHLQSMSERDEANFWRPSGTQAFRVLQPGEMFLFKLHGQHRSIVGGGFYAGFVRLPVSIAWDYFGEKNGAPTLDAMTFRVMRYSRELAAQPLAARHSHLIGCVLLEQVFFFSKSEWIPEPADWAANTQQGKSYAAETATAHTLIASVADRVSGERLTLAEGSRPRYGKPQLVAPRLGQGSFRSAVLEAYGRQCAVTADRVIHVLEASHIRPFAEGGPHIVSNGLLLRSDLHTLYDRGYITVTPDYRIAVSRTLRDEFDNGREYLELSGAGIHLPRGHENHPEPSLLAWHGREIFRGRAA